VQGSFRRSRGQRRLRWRMQGRSRMDCADQGTSGRGRSREAVQRWALRLSITGVCSGEPSTRSAT